MTPTFGPVTGSAAASGASGLLLELGEEVHHCPDND